MTLYCATKNPGKVREFRMVAEHFGRAGEIRIEMLPGLDAIEPPEEIGATFEENAALKAIYYSRFTEELVFADDSGLAVDALGGAPGIYSARYAGEDAGDSANNALLLERMRGVAERSARFVCSIAVARRGSLVASFGGVVEGELLDAPRGDGGFGYDPLFYFREFGCTLAEVDASRKMEVSHRGKAAAAMIESLGSRKQ
ncbi:MAG: RdgB/HAM1 family non-canonical purine NTP pyrophosphatase [Bryobacteraceae bacterium]